MSVQYVPHTKHLTWSRSPASPGGGLPRFDTIARFVTGMSASLPFLHFLHITGFVTASFATLAYIVIIIFLPIPISRYSANKLNSEYEGKKIYFVIIFICYNIFAGKARRLAVSYFISFSLPKFI